MAKRSKAKRRASYIKKWRVHVLSGKAGLCHPEPAPTPEELQALIARDALADERQCLEPNPEGKPTYYERGNGGPWVRRY